MAKSNPSFWTLSEALSWIAFGSEMDRGALNSELAGTSFGLPYIDAKTQLEDAVGRLADQAHAGLIELQARFHECAGNPTQTQKIDPVNLRDYRAFDITNDGLRFGTGVLWLPDENGVWEYVEPARTEFFADVIVERASVLEVLNRGTLPSTNGGADLPRLPEAGLGSWWQNLSPDQQAMSQDTLLEDCRAAHPDHRVTRDRIRSLTSGRKRGPKPITR